MQLPLKNIAGAFLPLLAERVNYKIIQKLASFRTLYHNIRIAYPWSNNICSVGELGALGMTDDSNVDDSVTSTYSTNEQVPPYTLILRVLLYTLLTEPAYYNFVQPLSYVIVS